jgi:enhancing lycopene biosynthesis protein 2
LERDGVRAVKQVKSPEFDQNVMPGFIPAIRVLTHEPVDDADCRNKSDRDELKRIDTNSLRSKSASGIEESACERLS